MCKDGEKCGRQSIPVRRLLCSFFSLLCSHFSYQPTISKAHWLILLPPCLAVAILSYMLVTWPGCPWSSYHGYWWRWCWWASYHACAPTFLTNQSFLKPTDWFSYHPPRGHLTLLLVGGDHVGACSVETMPCKVSSTQMSQINTSMLERAGQANILNFFFLCLFTCCQTFPDVY